MTGYCPTCSRQLNSKVVWPPLTRRWRKRDTWSTAGLQKVLGDTEDMTGWLKKNADIIELRMEDGSWGWRMWVLSGCWSNFHCLILTSYTNWYGLFKANLFFFRNGEDKHLRNPCKASPHSTGLPPTAPVPSSYVLSGALLKSIQAEMYGAPVVGAVGEVSTSKWKTAPEIGWPENQPYLEGDTCSKPTCLVNPC